MSAGSSAAAEVGLGVLVGVAAGLGVDTEGISVITGFLVEFSVDSVFGYDPSTGVPSTIKLYS